MSLAADQIKSAYAEAMTKLKAKAYDEALKGFRKIVEQNPEIAEAHFQVANIAFQTDRPHLAIGPLKTAARLRPGESEIWKGWAKAVALGGNEEDEKAFLSALKNAPVRPDLKIPLQDRFGARKSRSVPQLGGADPKVLMRLGAMIKAGQAAEVEAHCSRLIRQFPQSAPLFNFLGGAQAMQDKVASAETNFQTAIRLDPAYAEAYDNLARLKLRADRLEAAIPDFQQALIHAPYLLPALIDLGACFIRQDKNSAAIPLLERAWRINPTVPATGISLTGCYMQKHQYTQAEEVAEKVVALTGEKVADMLVTLGRIQTRLERDVQSVESFRKALELDPEHSGAINGMASALQTLGRFEDARQYFDQAFAANTRDGGTYSQYVQGQKMKADQPIIAQMTALYQDPSLPWEDRMDLAFALLKTHEDIKDYATAETYLLAANDLMSSHNPPNMKQRHAQVASIIRECGGFNWAGAKVPGSTDFAPIFITGMPRSGTTLVEQIISCHSTVTGAGELGEANILAQKLFRRGDKRLQLAQVGPEAVAKLGKDYEAYINKRLPGAGKITDKAIGTYLYIGLMRLAMPNARIVVVRRDPRDNLLSIYKNRFAAETHSYAYDQMALVEQYATFVEILDFWRKEVPDWFYEVQYEDLVSNTEEETRKLIAACGLEWEDACLSPHKNDRAVQTLSIFQVRQPVSTASVQSWKRYEKGLQPMLTALKERGFVTD